MRRRSVLTSALAGSISLAGCTSAPGLSGPDLPDECPTSQDLEVEWPAPLDGTTVAAFVESYEAQYYRQTDFDFEPDSQFSYVGSAISRVEEVTEADDGWRVHCSGILGVNQAFMHLKATRSEPPAGAGVLSRSQLDDERLIGLLVEAVETGEAERDLEADEVDTYVDRFERLSEGFEISRAEPRDTLYVDGNGTTVELVVSVDTYHADRFWDAWYYVNEHVVWRSWEQGIDPRDGELLECRTDG